MLQTHELAELYRRTPKIALEQPLKLALRQAEPGSDFRDPYRLGNVVFYELDRGPNDRIDVFARPAHGVALRCLGSAHRVMNDLIGNFGGQLLAMAGRDQVQHQIYGCGTAGTRHDVAVDRVELFTHDDGWKLLGKAWHA